MECPYIRIEESGATIPLLQEVTTVGRGRSVDVQLAEPSVSMLHAEIVRRGPYVYVTDLGLSRNGTRVNGRLVARRLLADGDVLTFGSARCRVGGIEGEDLTADAELRRPAAPELTRRELDVVTSLCRPALSDAAFVAPATAREIAVDLVVTEAAVKQHLLRLYQKFRIPEGANRRVRLANEVVALGLVRPLPQAEVPDRPQAAGAAIAPGMVAAQADPSLAEQARAEAEQPVTGHPAIGQPATSQPGPGQAAIGQSPSGHATAGRTLAAQLGAGRPDPGRGGGARSIPRPRRAGRTRTASGGARPAAAAGPDIGEAGPAGSRSARPGDVNANTGPGAPSAGSSGPRWR